MILNTYQGHMTKFKTFVICYLLLHWALSNCLWPLLRFSSCTHDQDSRTPTNKMLTLTLRITHKHVFPPTKIITPFIYHVSLSQKLSYAKKNSMGYAKKRKEKMFMPKDIRKNACQRAWRKEKKETKIAHTFK